jgi:Arm DNA-binding domain
MSKSPAGTPQVKLSNGRLQIVLTYGGKRKYLSLGLSESKQNRDYADMVRSGINLYRSVSRCNARRCCSGQGLPESEDNTKYLTQLGACCKWAVKSKLIAVNPFLGMAADKYSRKINYTKYWLKAFYSVE